MQNALCHIREDSIVNLEGPVENVKLKVGVGDDMDKQVDNAR